MNNLSLSRILKLIKFEFLLHRKYYLTILIGALMLITLVFLIVWDQTRGFSTGWQQKHYQYIYIWYQLAVAIFIVGQSFKDLRTKASSERYLLLPASHMEKLLAQVFTKVSLTVIVMPIVFWLGSLLARGIGLSLMRRLLKINFSEKIEFLSFESLWMLPEGQLWSAYALFIGIIFIVFSSMFMGGVYFGKLSVVFTPLAKVLFVLITLLSSMALFSWHRNNNINVDDLEVFDGVPLFVFVLILLLFSGSFLSYVISYYKLKEREV